MSSNLVELSFRPDTLPCGTSERPIDRELLIDIAPDRADLLMNGAIQHIRKALKLNLSEVTPECVGCPIYRCRTII